MTTSEYLRNLAEVLEPEEDGVKLTKGSASCIQRALRTAADAITQPEAVSRSAVLMEAMDACRSEYLEDEPDNDDDRAYQQAVTDCVCAVQKLLIASRSEPQDGFQGSDK